MDKPPVTLSLSPAITTLVTDSGSAVLPWFWLGANDVTSDTVWENNVGKGKYPLFSYSSLTFDPNGGTLSGADTNGLIKTEVYPEWVDYDTFNFAVQPLAAVGLPAAPVGFVTDGVAWEFAGWDVPNSGLVPLAATEFQPGFGFTTLTARWETPQEAPAADGASTEPEVADSSTVALTGGSPATDTNFAFLSLYAVLTLAGIAGLFARSRQATVR
jgi:hypothetical protein